MIITTEQKNLLETAIDLYGKDIQKIIAIEELSELQKEVTKEIRGKYNRENIIEELSDVFIMLNQLKIIFNIRDREIRKCIEKKLERLRVKLKNDYLPKLEFYRQWCSNPYGNCAGCPYHEKELCSIKIETALETLQKGITNETPT